MSQPSRGAESWPEPELEPSCLVVSWPDDTTPTLTGGLAALSSAWKGEVTVLIESKDSASLGDEAPVISKTLVAYPHLLPRLNLNTSELLVSKVEVSMVAN